MARLLLVEDDPLMLDLYSTIFTLENDEVFSARDGEEGLQKAQELHPDLILLDIMMPKKDGIAVLEKLKQNESTRNIPVIILTNLADQSKADQALQRGAEKYLIKSEFNPDILVSEVKEVLHR